MGVLVHWVFDFTTGIYTMKDVQEIISALVQFRNERDWEQFHNPKDLALAINIEASELLELFLWKKSEDADINKIKKELADIFSYAFLLADKYDLDVKEIVLDKIYYDFDKSNIREDATITLNVLVDLMKMAIENASIEVQIKGDSLYGIINTMELENSIQSKIFLRNDSLLIIDQESEICLMETEGGISLSPLNSEITFELRKTENKELSEDTKTAINENK